MAELLSPAGNFEKLCSALRFGADAVYLAGQAFGMRSAADNFTDDELMAAAELVHGKGKKMYLTKILNPAVILAKRFTTAGKKAFGDLYYEK